MHNFTLPKDHIGLLLLSNYLHLQHYFYGHVTESWRVLHLFKFKPKTVSLILSLNVTCYVNMQIYNGYAGLKNVYSFL